MQKATRFFVLNRISFSGTVDAGGYSQSAYEDRFTDSSIKNLKAVGDILDNKNVQITNLDYEKMVLAAPTDCKNNKTRVFLFLDPPYYAATNSKLYGKNGALHTGFDHERFAAVMAKCPHKWLITYDDSPFIRELFSFAKIVPWKLQYGMNNYKQEKAAMGNCQGRSSFDPVRR